MPVRKFWGLERVDRHSRYREVPICCVVYCMYLDSYWLKLFNSLKRDCIHVFWNKNLSIRNGDVSIIGLQLQQSRLLNIKKKKTFSFPIALMLTVIFSGELCKCGYCGNYVYSRLSRSLTHTKIKYQELPVEISPARPVSPDEGNIQIPKRFSKVTFASATLEFE